MPAHVCPHWAGYWLASPLRRLIHKPERILAPFVTRGMTVLDVGPAMGFFTLPLAAMVGPGGMVVCVDVQEAMLRSLEQRAAAAGLADRILARVCKAESIGLDDFEGRIDFALAFAVVHEIPDVPNFFAQVCKVLKPRAQCLIAEPKLHVSKRNFHETLVAAERAGLRSIGRPGIRWSHTSLLRKD